MEGLLWLSDVSYVKAEELLLDGGADRAVAWRLRVAERRKRNILARFDRSKRKVAKVRDRKAKALNEELAKLREDERTMRDGYLKDKV